MNGTGQEIEIDDDPMTVSFLGSLQPSAGDEVSRLMLQELGSVSRSYKRERRGAFKRIVTEVYSPPRVTAELIRMKNKELLPGFAFDVTTLDPDDGMPWDFSLKSKQDKALKMIESQEPYMLIGSPMCKAFCSWQFLNFVKSKDKEAMRKFYLKAVEHMRFVVRLYRMQHDAGRYFLHEHPSGATSWKLDFIENLLNTPGIERTVGDQCQFGAEVMSGPKQGQPVKKPSGFMSNSPELLKVLNRRCLGGATPGSCSRARGGTHVHAEGKVARDAAVYPPGLCRAIIKGVSAQLRADGLTKRGCFGIQARDDEDEISKACMGPEQGYSGKYRDDLTGQVLKDELVIKARLVELQFFHQKGVWVKRPMDRARAVTGKPPITVRWVDVNKGDEQSPNYRSRLVARQMKCQDSSDTSYFAPAPPLEALRTVLSMAVTSIGEHKPILSPTSPMRSQVSFIDIKRAYFNAKIDEREAPTFVRLPEEDEDAATKCAQLLRHMYGTRMAADGWQEEYSVFLISLGFLQGTASPNLFFHKGRRLRCSVHGDDFTTSGPHRDLNWFEEEMAKHYEMTVGPRLGPGDQDAKEARALNRVVRWTPSGIEYEADPRQAERLIQECGLEGSNVISTPGVRQTAKDIAEDQPLPSKLATPFRGSAARGNYLGPDRLDAQFSFKEICRFMSSPTTASWTALKRVCRFLVGRPRLVYKFYAQEVSHLDVYTDTDWAGCPRTRKSTSGGCVMLGGHAMKHWSSTQSSTALSSGEAEFNGVVRGSGQGLGYQSLLRDLGVTLPLRVWTDSTAAIGICSRQGLGKLRHLDTHTLWVQQAVRTGRVDLKKILGEENPADLFTKHSLSKPRMDMLVAIHGCEYVGGRAESAPQVRKGASDKFTLADSELNVTESAGPAVCMPHLELTQEVLDERFPSLTVPAEEELDDSLAELADRRDPVYQHGLAIAQKIADDMRASGRTRRATAPMSPISGPPGPAKSAQRSTPVDEKGAAERTVRGLPTRAGGPSAAGGLNLIFEDVGGIDKDEADNYCASKVPEDLQAYPSSSLCRRRSVKGSCPLIAKSSQPSSDRVVSRKQHHFIKQYSGISSCALRLHPQPF